MFISVSSVIKMENHLVFIFLAFFLSSAYFTEPGDQHCNNRVTEQIPVGITDDKPQKILTFVKHDPGYAKNLECRWELRASDPSRPRQMLLNVKKVDFDTNVTSDQCNSSAVDVFSFTFSGNSNENQVKEQKWCKKSQIPVTKKLMLGNLWNSYNRLIVEFKSDDNQIRNNAQGVEMDVVIMAEKFCHRDLLFHSGSCYLVTEDELNFTEAYELSKSLLGNLATFSNKESLNQFIKSNQDREQFFPFTPALNFTKKVWTGHHKLSIGNIQFLNRTNDCKIATSSLSVLHSNNSCGPVAMQQIGTEFTFTNENASERLQALIVFSQIPATIGDRHPKLFTTCNIASLIASTLCDPAVLYVNTTAGATPTTAIPNATPTTAIPNATPTTAISKATIAKSISWILLADVVGILSIIHY